MHAWQFRNSAVSATTSSYTSQCVADFVPPDADLVLVEFSVNDWEVMDPASFTWMDNSLRWGLLPTSFSTCRCAVTAAIYFALGVICAFQ